MLADISIEVILGMPFLTFSNADIQSAKKELVWRSYVTAEALLTTKRVELIDSRGFAAAALDKNKETFGVHVASIMRAMRIHPF